MMRCNERAYVMCPDRTHCGSLAEAVYTEDSECAAFNRSVEDIEMTNAEKIRAMSDEELVRFVLQFSSPGYCCPGSTECVNLRRRDLMSITMEGCAECFRNWLKQPAEV